MLKPRLLFACALFFCLLSTHVQSQGSLVTVKGLALSAKDSTPVATGLHFDKLPYYDDMGTGSAKSDGNFEFLMRNGSSYILSTRNLQGYEPFEQEFKVTDDGSGIMSLTIYITPAAEPEQPVVAEATPEPEPEPEELEELIRLENLTFARGSARIASGSFAELDEFISYLDERPDVYIQLEGHTDFAGNADANMRLSEARVQAVAEYLIDGGIKKRRVSTKAFGGTKPLTQDRTDEGKAMNRRVEVRLTRN